MTTIHPHSIATKATSNRVQIPHGHELLVSLLEETALAAAHGQLPPPSPLSAADPSTPISAVAHSNNDHVRRPSSLLVRRLSTVGDKSAEPVSAALGRKLSRLPLADQQERGGHDPHHSPITPPSTPLTKDVFTDPEYQSYLDHLTSCSLDSLKNEPANLTREASRLQQQLADLAYTEYGSFLRANECTRAIRDTFTGLETRLNSLTKTLPELEAACTSFAASSAQEVLKDRRREHIVLNQHAKLVEILEIPQLMDTLIRNGYYDEAMDLQTHVQRLLLRYPQYKLLRSVASELDAATKVMLTQLVNLLKGDVKLPLCIRVMGYLRRMEAVPEPELRLIFLQQRDKFFKKRVEEACGNDRTTSDVARDHVEYVRKYIDVCRECFFDIVAQYRAIFSDATAPGTASRPNPASSASTSTLIYDTASHTTLTHSILSSYVIHRIQHLNATLQAHLPYINDASQVASLCTQTMYFGMSLSRVGIDFRAVISHVFEDAVEEIVRKAVEDGAHQFVAWVEEIKAFANSPTAPTSDIHTAFGSNVAPTSTASVAHNAATTHPFLKAIYVKHSAAPTSSTSTPTTPNPSRAAQSQVVQAPITLLAHPSIAHLLNAFYTAYNHLRALPSLALHHRVQSIVETNLTLCTNVLADAIATWWDSWSHSERSIVVLVTNAWSNVLVPNVVNGLNTVYSQSPVKTVQPLPMEKFTAPLQNYMQTGPDMLVESEELELGQPSSTTDMVNGDQGASSPRSTSRPEQNDPIPVSSTSPQTQSPTAMEDPMEPMPASQTTLTYPSQNGISETIASTPRPENSEHPNPQPEPVQKKTDGLTHPLDQPLTTLLPP
ncbi:hypothetical protein PhCBS80983_g01722 [Powellomyces hirtus]|uniref:Conserved oligomeric Golgi complex subunit 8 n=1 Tax=Powellomyces hirtus TaxID=109895 RepID=A0A507E9T4_9FUNG|nr:hypothetical protein PhCBS80983_g01722 [Powellomyces hirtus]